jgi:replication initiator protein RepSA
VIWNNLLGELWRRTTIYLPRKLAALTNMTQQRLREQVRVSYVKVSEYQRRGLVHLHPIIRLDKRMPEYRSGEIRPPDKRFTSELLEHALRAAAEAVKVEIPAELGSGTIRWGEQLDIEQLSAEEQPRRQRASYLAKYTTKSTEQAGGLLQRVDRDEVEHVAVREHVRGYMRTAFVLDDRVSEAIAADPPPAPPPLPAPRPAPATSRYPNELILRVLQAMSTDERILVRLHDGGEHIGQITRRTKDGLVLDNGDEIPVAKVCAITTGPPQPVKRDPRDRRLAACAHTLGYRGHCLTKSRRYSTTFNELRQARADHVHEQLLTNGDQKQRELVQAAPERRVSRFDFVGIGHLTTADAYLAAQAAARAREQRQLAREALYDHDDRGRGDRCGPPQDHA